MTSEEYTEMIEEYRKYELKEQKRRCKITNRYLRWAKIKRFLYRKYF